MADNLLKRRKRNDGGHMGQPIGGGPVDVISRTDLNIGSFHGNATLGGADDESARANGPAGIKPVISVRCGSSELAEQQQDDQYHQNDAADAHSAVAVAVTIAAETAAEPAEQKDDQDDDEDQSERHVRSPAVRRPPYDGRKTRRKVAKHIAGAGSRRWTKLPRNTVMPGLVPGI